MEKEKSVSNMGGFYGSVLEVAHFISAHIPLAKTQHMPYLTTMEAELCCAAGWPGRREN